MWPCIEVLILKCCTSKLRSHVDLKVCLNVTTNYLIFLLLSDSNRNTLWYAMSKYELIIFGNWCLLLYLKLFYHIFRIWIQTTPVNSPDEISLYFYKGSKCCYKTYTVLFFYLVGKHLLSLSYVFVISNERLYSFQDTQMSFLREELFL